MSTRTFRITVKGSFDGLTEEQRAALLADAARHSVRAPLSKRQRQAAAREDS
ncbi:DUF6204 family protein [Streptomyces sp. NPDC056773]|uniref:DUF6204 family protein n=1 Tax=unclassified Streptomyces TaxID=2593676 RepID=UPI0036778DB7